MQVGQRDASDDGLSCWGELAAGGVDATEDFLPDVAVPRLVVDQRHARRAKDESLDHEDFIDPDPRDARPKTGILRGSRISVLTAVLVKSVMSIERP